MQKILSTCLLLVILQHTSFCQFDRIHKDSITTFLITVEVFDAAFPGIEMVIQNSTIQSGVEYNEVYYYGQNIGLFREDSLSSKAWFWGNNDSEERLIMDLDLEVGDTFDVSSNYFYGCNGETIAIVESIDSIEGRKRINFNCDNGGGFLNETFQFIEGVGPNTSLVYLTNEEFDLIELTCKKYENDSLVFHFNPEEDDCFFSTINSNDIEKTDYKIFPNPFKESINIKSENNQGEFTIEILNIKGELLIKKQISNQSEIKLNNFPTGLYLYKVYTKKQVIIGKMIKQK
jgi:hypothetical protein